VLSASSDHTCRLWDTNSGACVQVLDGHSDEIFSCAFNYEGDTIITGSKDNTCRIWKAEDVKQPVFDLPPSTSTASASASAAATAAAPASAKAQAPTATTPVSSVSTPTATASAKVVMSTPTKQTSAKPMYAAASGYNEYDGGVNAIPSAPNSQHNTPVKPKHTVSATAAAPASASKLSAAAAAQYKQAEATPLATLSALSSSLDEAARLKPQPTYKSTAAAAARIYQPASSGSALNPAAAGAYNFSSANDDGDFEPSDEEGGF
jgi:hypothetical protein